MHEIYLKDRPRIVENVKALTIWLPSGRSPIDIVPNGTIIDEERIIKRISGWNWFILDDLTMTQ